MQLDSTQLDSAQLGSTESESTHQHVVFGAGLIGGFLYGALASQGFSVAMVARPSVQEKLRGGLQLSDYQDNTATVSSPCFVAKENVAADYVWLTVKCTAIADVAADLRGYVHENTVIFCCQNGLGSDGFIKQVFPNNRVLKVMVPFNVVEMSPGHLHRGSEGQLTLECNDPSTVDKDVLSIIKQLHSPLMPVCGSEDIKAILWAKLQLNLVNAINALADIPVKPMLEERGYRRCMALLMEELLAVVNKKNISLPKLTALPPFLIPKLMKVPDVVFRILASKMLAVDPNVRTSMWWDLSNAKHTEIEFINGAILEEAKVVGVDCPAN